MRLFALTNVLVLVAFLKFGNILAQTKTSDKNSQIRTSADKYNPSYHADIEYKLQGMAYNKGHKHWQKSKKQYKYFAGSWDEVTEGYHWKEKTWTKPKHYNRYHNNMLILRPQKSFGNQIKKSVPVKSEKTKEKLLK